MHRQSHCCFVLPYLRPDQVALPWSATIFWPNLSSRRFRAGNKLQCRWCHSLPELEPRVNRDIVCLLQLYSWLTTIGWKQMQPLAMTEQFANYFPDETTITGRYQWFLGEVRFFCSSLVMLGYYRIIFFCNAPIVSQSCFPSLLAAPIDCKNCGARVAMTVGRRKSSPRTNHGN